MRTFMKLNKHSLTAQLESLVLIHPEFVWYESSYLNISHLTFWIDGLLLKVFLPRQRFYSSSWGGERTAVAENQEFPSTALNMLPPCTTAWVLQPPASALWLQCYCDGSEMLRVAGRKQWGSHQREEEEKENFINYWKLMF